MNQSIFAEANKMFGINVELYPNSANIYDSYAESFLKLGKKDEAIKYYKMAIDKNPHGPTGDNARNMLKQIEEEKVSWRLVHL